MSNEKESPPSNSEGANSLSFRANLTDRQHSLMMSGKGDRCLIELEAYGLDAVVALVGLTKFTGKSFIVTVTEITGESWTKLDDAIGKGTERSVITVGRGGSTHRRDQQPGE